MLHRWCSSQQTASRELDFQIRKRLDLLSSQPQNNNTTFHFRDKPEFYTGQDTHGQFTILGLPEPALADNDQGSHSLS